MRNGLNWDTRQRIDALVSANKRLMGEKKELVERVAVLEGIAQANADDRDAYAEQCVELEDERDRARRFAVSLEQEIDAARHERCRTAEPTPEYVPVLAKCDTCSERETA